MLSLYSKHHIVLLQEKGNVYFVYVRCLVNCASRAVPTMKLSLVLDCTQCATLDESVFKWDLFIRTGRDYILQDLTSVAASGTL